MDYLKALLRRSGALAVAIISGALGTFREITGWLSADLRMGSYRLNIYFLVLIGAVFWRQYGEWRIEKNRADALESEKSTLQGTLHLASTFHDIRENRQNPGTGLIKVGIVLENTSTRVIRYRPSRFTLSVAGQELECLPEPGRVDTIAPGKQDTYVCDDYVVLQPFPPPSIPISVDMAIIYSATAEDAPQFEWTRKVAWDLGQIVGHPEMYAAPSTRTWDVSDIPVRGGREDRDERSDGVEAWPRVS